MSELIINGGRKIEGLLKLQGAKNAVLPILAASVINGGVSRIYNCPDLSDVDCSIQVLRHLGCSVKREADCITVDSSGADKSEIPDSLMKNMRSSMIFLGAILARFKKADICLPGGCELGARPIDMHLDAFRRMGVKITELEGRIVCNADKVFGADIHLAFPSVGATENIMILASRAEGETVIHNAAREPEIEDLQNYLVKMGAKIKGGGTSRVVIEGTDKLSDVSHSVIADRIACATYIACSAVTGGILEIDGVNPEHLRAVLDVFENGGKIYESRDSLIYVPKGRLKAAGVISTAPYPAFPTDAQSPVMSVMCLAEGTTVFEENIFESRFKQVPMLARMGADICITSKTATVRGVERLNAARVRAMDLRGGASLVIAALAADGISTVENVHYIDRGYEKIEDTLNSLGAKIKRKSS